MKGLLIKDFKLMFNQKNFFILIVLILGATACFLDFDYYFLIGYFMFICSLSGMADWSKSAGRFLWWRCILRFSTAGFFPTTQNCVSMHRI